MKELVFFFSFFSFSIYVPQLLPSRFSLPSLMPVEDLFFFHVVKGQPLLKLTIGGDVGLLPTLEEGVPGEMLRTLLFPLAMGGALRFPSFFPFLW